MLKFIIRFTNLIKMFIYNLTNDSTIILNTAITNNMLLHVSTFKMSSSGSSLCPEDDILSVETCRSMLFVIVVFDIVVQSLVKF